MPLINLSMRKGRPNHEKKELLDIVHNSLTDAFKIPDTDRIQRISEFDECDFEIPENKSNKFTIIEISQFPGRSFEAKKKLYQLVFSRLKEVGYQDNDAIIILTEPKLENWGLSGGVPGSEFEFSFNVNV